MVTNPGFNALLRYMDLMQTKPTDIHNLCPPLLFSKTLLHLILSRRRQRPATKPVILDRRPYLAGCIVGLCSFEWREEIIQVFKLLIRSPPSALRSFLNLPFCWAFTRILAHGQTQVERCSEVNGCQIIQHSFLLWVRSQIITNNVCKSWQHLNSAGAFYFQITKNC